MPRIFGRLKQFNMRDWHLPRLAREEEEEERSCSSAPTTGLPAVETALHMAGNALFNLRHLASLSVHSSAECLSLQWAYDTCT